MDPKKKSVYHSGLAGDDGYYITVTSGKLTSRFKGEGEVGHFYVEFEFDGVKHTYIAENEECADTLAQYKGQSVTVRAIGRGNEGTAEIEILNTDGTTKQQRPASKPQQQKPPQRGSTTCAKPPQQSAQKPDGKHVPVFGATVGMAINQAVGILKEFDYPLDYFLGAEFSRDTYTIASDIIRISERLEAGKLAEPVKNRTAPAPTKPEPKRDPEPQKQEPQTDDQGRSLEQEESDIPF